MTHARPLPPDTHGAQAERVASHCERNPGRFFTVAEFDKACDLGSPTKVLSAMGVKGYGVAKAWRHVACAKGTRTRRVRTYRVAHRPRGEQPSLLFDA